SQADPHAVNLRRCSRRVRNCSARVSTCARVHSYRRLAAFSSISSSHDEPWSPRQWLPVLHNLIFFIRMDEEFGVLSSNAADGIRRLVQEASDCQSQETKAVFDEYLKQILMPSIYGGAREESETVRREYLRVLGFILT
ncbi:hypothetical protein EWS82_13210, partial [Staphylococcus xylosus]|nr:hypothetical protein [Staphylococcus xylosus]